MFARSVLSNVRPVGFDGRVTLPITTSLSGRLDAILTVLPAVATFGPDLSSEATKRIFGLAGADLVTRRVRLVDGRSVTVVAVPSRSWHQPDTRSNALAVKRVLEADGRRVVLVPEGALDREPLGTNALLIADCAGAQVSPSDRLALLIALTDTGGSMPLADAAEIMVRSDDPVAAVLALVAARIVSIDLGGPVGPDSSVQSSASSMWTQEAVR